VTAGDDPAEDGAPGGPLTLAAKLDRCFLTMHPKDRGEWTYKEVAAGVADLGVAVSPSYLWQLRRGKKDNPTVRQIEVLARFFHVPMTYFFGTDDEVDNIDAQMTVVRALRSPEVQEVAVRASSLTPAGLRAIAHIIDELQAVEGMAAPRARKRRNRAADDEPDEVPRT
jgi:transcriptional regulator with XRE-family HTH domain